MSKICLYWSFGKSRPWTWYMKLPQDEEARIPQPDSGTQKPVHSAPQKWAPFRWMILRAGLPVSFILLVIIIAIVNRNLSIPRFAPILRITPVVFKPNEMFMAQPSSESNAAWDSLMPGGRGFVLVGNPERYKLGPGIPTNGWPDRYSVSMFHQLHCLGVIREMYYASMRGEKAELLGDEGVLSETEREQEQLMHIGHCFDYLRQALMCAGDMTLEGAILLSDGKVSSAGVDGWGVIHQCRSWDQAVSWTLEHKAPNNHTGIA